MTEATVVRRLITDLKRLLPGVIIMKLNDLSTAGVPDVSIDHRGRHVWVEVKYCRRGESRSVFLKHFEKLQLAANALLARQASAWYLIAYDQVYHGITTEAATRGLCAVLYSPRYLKEFLELPDLQPVEFHSHYLTRGSFGHTVDYLAGIVRRS